MYHIVARVLLLILVGLSVVDSYGLVAFFGGVVVPKNLFFDVILCSASGFIGAIIAVSKAGV